MKRLVIRSVANRAVWVLMKMKPIGNSWCALRCALLISASLIITPAVPHAIAQVGPDDWYFEIDGDYGSVLEYQAPAHANYLPSLKITDGEGANRHTTYAPKEGVRIDNTNEPACTDWYHTTNVPYMGAQAYRVQAIFDGNQPNDTNPRRSEQMLLNDWYTGTDSARYFTLAFRFNTIGAIEEPKGFIAQWHHGGADQPAVLLAWAYKNGAYYLRGGVYNDATYTNLFLQPASPDVWYRMLFLVDPGPELGFAGCDKCPTDQGLVRAWMMNAQTSSWELWGEYQGQLGYRYITPKGQPRRYRTGDELAYQWKVGHYVNETDWISLDYDNVAYGKRWNNITKNRLIGYKKSVLNLKFDEGSGTVANDNCWSWNGGQRGDATMDYDNDGSLQGNVSWSTDGVGFWRRSLSFGGGYVNVPIDKIDFDFGNYVSVSAWFKTTAKAAQPQGLISIDEHDGAGKLYLARADDRLSFGVRHPDGTYSEVIYNHPPGRYADGRWHHVAGTFNRFIDDNRRVKIYIDGVRVLQRQGYDKPLLRGDDHLVIGKVGISGSFRGNIDEVNVMNYSMTDAEVAALVAQNVAPNVRIWDGGSAGSGNWTADANWQGNVQPAPGDFLVFPAGAARLTNTNTFSHDTLFGGIIFQGDGYNIYGNAVTISNHITAEFGASGNVFRPDIRLSAPVAIRAQGSNLQLTLLGDIDLNGHDLTLVCQAGQLVCAGVISGTGDVTKTGSGRAVFSGIGANTYSGTTYVLGGFLDLSKYLLLNPGAVRWPRVAVPGNLVIGLGTSSLIGDAVVCEANNQIADNALVTIRATGELNLNDYGNTILFLHMSGGHATTGNGTLTVSGNIVCDPDNDGSTISGHLDLGPTGKVVMVSQDALLAVPAVVSGPANSPFFKDGPGELRLMSANTFAGQTVLLDGTLRILANDALGAGTNGVVLEGGQLVLVDSAITGKTLTATGTGRIASEGLACAWNGDVVLTGGELIVRTEPNSMLSWTGQGSGSGGLRKVGAGIFRIFGTSTHTGNTAIDQGTLLVNGGLNVSGIVEVGSGAILGGTGVVGDVVASSGAGVRPGVSPGELTANSLNLLSGSVLDIELNGLMPVVDYDRLRVPGTVTLGGLLDVTLGFVPAAGDSFLLLNKASPGAITGAFSGLTEGATFAVSDLSFQITYTGGDGNDVVLTRVAAPVSLPIIHTWTGAVSGNWSEPRNWSPATVPAADPIIFAGNATRRIITNDLPTRAYGNITFQGDNFDIYGNAIILGSQSGGNTITSRGGAVSNAFHLDIILAGPVTVSAVGNFGVKTLSFLGDISLGSHQLTFVTDGDATCSGVISGTGGVTKSDRGRLVFSGSSANTYSGATVVTEGILELSKSGVTAVPGDLHIGIGVNSPTKATAVYTAPDQIANDAEVFVLHTGELSLNNYNDTVGSVELSGGNITTGTGILTINSDIVCAPADVNGSSISGKLNLGTGRILIDVRADTLLDISAVVSSGPRNIELQKVGPGELRLRSANAYAALTRVSDGTLRVTASDGLGNNDVRLEGGKLVLANATINSGKTLVALAPGMIAVEGQSSSWTGPLSLTGIVDIDATANSSLVHSGRIDGSGGFRKTGAGQLRLEGVEANTFQGGADFIQGTLELAKPAGVVAIPSTLIVGDTSTQLNKAVLRYVNSDQIANSADLIVERSGQVMMRDRSDGIGSLSGAGAIQLGAATLTIGDSAAQNVAPVFAGVISGTGGLVKTGGGTLTLTGINTYTGDTVVEQGTLLVHGALAPASLVRVLSGCTLGGNGQVHDVSVASLGRLSPGASPGNFTANNVQLTTGTLGIELNENGAGTGYDQLTARGNVTLGGALDVSLGFVPAVGDTFVILRKTSSGPVSGTFNGLPEGATFALNGETFQVTYKGGNGNDVVLTHTASNPSSVASNFFGLQHAPLGKARLTDGTSGDLIVGNLDSTGEDGVRITLDNAQGWQGQVTALDPGTGRGILSWEIQSTRNNVAGQAISRGSMEVIKGEIHAFADSSGVGAAAHWVEVFAGEEFLKSALVPSNAPLCRLLPPFTKPPAMTLRYDGPFPGKSYWTCEISWLEPCRIVVPGTDDSPLDGATRVRLIPWAAKELVQGEPLSALQLMGKNISEFRIFDEALILAPVPADEGLPHRALGHARFEARDGQLIVSNIGSSGEDGVSIEVGDRANGIGMLTAPVSLTPDGTVLTLGAVGTFDGVPGTSLGTASLRTVGAAVQATADFTSVGSTAVRVEVFRGTEMVGSAKEAAGVVMTLASATGQGGLPSLQAVGLVPAVLPGMEGIEQTAFEPLPCYFFAFDRAIEFTTRTGERFVGDRLRLLTANDQPRVQTLARFDIRAAFNNGASGLTITLEKLRLPAPEITRVFPPQARSGELVEILGRGFGDDPTDLSVVGSARIAGLDHLTVRFRVLSASDTRILARVGTVPPGTPSGPIQVYRGVGNEGTPQGLPTDIEFMAPIRAWREGTPSGSSGNDTAYQPARILPPERCFESGPPVDGVLSLYLYDWRPNAVVSFSSHVTATIASGGASLDASGVRFVGGGNVLDGAQWLANVLEAAFAQQAGLIVKVQALTTTDPGTAQLTLSLPGGFITSGFLKVCVEASERVLTVANVSPLRATEGDLITINGQGFGSDTRDLLVGVRDTKGARLIPMEVLRVTDTQILARMGPVPPDFTQGPIEVRREEGSRVRSAAQAEGGVHEIWQGEKGVARSTGDLGLGHTGLTTCYYSLDNTYISDEGVITYPPPGDLYRPPVLVMPLTWPQPVEVTINAEVFYFVPTFLGSYLGRRHYETTLYLPPGGTAIQNLARIARAFRDPVAEKDVCPSIGALIISGDEYKLIPYFDLDCFTGLVQFMAEFSVCVRSVPDQGVITHTTTSGNSMTISGRGFGIEAEDLSVAMLDGGGARLIPLEVLAASDTEITARIGAVPPDALAGPIMVTRGKGSFNSPQPFFDDASVDSAWTWFGRETSVVSAQLVTSPSTPPEKGQQWFFSEPPKNGELNVSLDGDWSSDVIVSIAAGIHDNKNSAAYELSVPALRFAQALKLVDGAERIADVIRSGFWQQAALPVDVKITSSLAGQVKLSLSLPHGYIHRGFITIGTRLTPPTAPLPKLTIAPGGSIQLVGTGQSGRTYTLEATTGFTPPIVWTVIATAQADANGKYEFTEFNALRQPMRFYRVISP